MILILLGSAKRVPHEDLLDKIKEALVRFNQNADNRKVLARIVTQLDDDAKIRLSFLSFANN
jgi:hypothetical protein